MKKLLKLSVLTAGLLTLMGACSNDEMPDFPTPDSTTQTPPSGLDRALRIVDEMMKELDGGATRSSRRIATIEQVNQLTRSNAQAPNWFLVNYDDEAGFALVNDAKIDLPVYAISDTGHISMSDTIENKGLAMVLNNIFVMGYVDSLNEAANAANMTPSASLDDWEEGSIPGNPIKPFTHPDSMKMNWKPVYLSSEKIVVKPLLTEYVQKWGQGEPFNILCPMVYNETTGEEKRGYVGCAPLAIAMIMSHYQWPNSYYSASPDETYEFHWDEIRDYPYRYAMSRLTREISRAYNMDANWTFGATSAAPRKALQTFENFGYIKPKFDDFDKIAFNTISDNAPILTLGSRYNEKGERTGHMWVVDGLCKFTPEHSSEIHVTPSYYYHNVWGWDGRANGYFKMFSGISTDMEYRYDDPTLGNKIGYTYNLFAAIGRVYPR